MPLKQFKNEVLINRIRFENSWWRTGQIDEYFNKMPRRIYFRLFKPLVLESNIKKGILLLGQRGVGKTAIFNHTIQELINQKVKPENIIFLSVDVPVFRNMQLENILALGLQAAGQQQPDDCYFFIKEMQYLNNWEEQLRDVVKKYTNARFIASSSLAVKNLNIGSQNCSLVSFFLPVLSFYEYLEAKNADQPFVFNEEECNPEDFKMFNEHFINYMNYGSYHEAVLSRKIKPSQIRKVANTFIDKILRIDIPNLVGIRDIQKMNALFTHLAYNSGVETSFEELSSFSGLTVEVVQKYFDYFENAFLIKRVHQINLEILEPEITDRFKFYITNPSLRSALFIPVTEESPGFDEMVETALIVQYQHIEDSHLFYANSENGKVDLVRLYPNKKPKWTVEVKWSNEHAKHPEKLMHVKNFCEKHNLPFGLATTKTYRDMKDLDGFIISFEPTSMYCYSIGKQIVENRFNNYLTY